MKQLISGSKVKVTYNGQDLGYVVVDYTFQLNQPIDVIPVNISIEDLEPISDCPICDALNMNCNHE